MRPSKRLTSLLVTGVEPLATGRYFATTPAYEKPPPINIGDEEMTGA
jgi:hypothetical protein